MPRLPKLIGDMVEFMFCKVTVSSTEMITPTIKRIEFKGQFPKVKFKIGQAIIVKIDDTNYRNYTPSFWDSASGVFEVLFHLHGNGPGSHFVEKLKQGDLLNIGMPRGFEIYKAASKYHFFFGDETCISVFKSLKEIINRDENNYFGVLELDSLSLDVTEAMGIMVDVVPKSTNRASFAIDALHQLEGKMWNLWSDGFFYLMGNARSIQNFRKALKERGVSGRNIYTQPFWADGKVGL